MRKSSLLMGVLSSSAIRAQDGEFHGQAAMLTDTTDVDGDTVMSCAQPEEAKCVGQCAEVWCDSNKIGDCSFGSRPIVRVADRCAACESGDLFLSRDIFQQLLGASTYTYSFPVRWKCVDCGTKVGNEQVAGDTIRHGSEGRVHAAQALENMTDQVAHQPIEEGALGCSLSGQNIAGSSDTKVKILPVNANDKNKGNGVNENSSGGGFSFSFGPPSGDMKQGDIQWQKTTVPPTSTPLTSTNSANDASSSPHPTPSPTISSSSSSSFDGESSSGGSGSSLSSSAPNEDPSYSVETTPFDNSQDALALSTSSRISGTTSNQNQPPTSTPTLSPYQMSDDTIDSSLSATSSVTKSPFFYASITLGIVGLIGAIVGYRAKQKRSYRDERRAFRMFSQTRTDVSNPRPVSSAMAAQASRTRPDSHTITVL